MVLVLLPKHSEAIRFANRSKNQGDKGDKSCTPEQRQDCRESTTLSGKELRTMNTLTKKEIILERWASISD